MAIRTTITTLTASELAEEILNFCDGFFLAGNLEDIVVAGLDAGHISTSTEEVVEALRRLVKEDRLRSKIVFLAGKKIDACLQLTRN